MKKDPSYLYFSGPLVEYEDILVGNRKGLEELKAAIEEALEDGQSSVSAGEFIGVKCLETEKFNEKIRHKNTAGSKIGFILIGIMFLITMLLVWLSSTT